ncbi:MAG: DHA2 family efflux MFS transporter permease subunit, partial [Bacteroidetes bacterium]|nr:DHA2 family efflux MFS transporter permease subunit [Bacteroidota bacterium]
MSSIPLKHWLAVFAVSFGSFSSLLSSTTIEVAFPNLMGSFGIELKSAQWTITLYMILMVMAMLISADMVKRLGIKKVSGISFTLFIFSTWLGGISDNTATLFVARALQGFSAGLQAPLGAIVVISLFPKERIGAAMGIFGAVMLLAPSIGPVIGGFIIEYFSWRVIFFFQIPLSVISLILGIIFLPRGEISSSGKYDSLGLAILMGFISSLFFSFHYLRELGGNSLEFQLSISLCIFTIYFFYKVETLAANPIVNIEVFKIVPFTLNLWIIFFLGAGMFSSILLIPFYLLKTLGYPPGQVGLALLPAGIFMVITSPLAGMLSDRVAPAKVIIPSLCVFSLSGFYLSSIQIGTPLIYIVIGSIIARLGLSFLLPSLYTNTIRALQGKHTEYGSSLMNFSRQIGGAIGVMYFSSEFAQNSVIFSKSIQEEMSRYNFLQSDYKFYSGIEDDFPQFTELENTQFIYNNI